MPLITCPDCNHQVSDQAPACPSCGRPISQKPTTIEETSKRFKIISLASALLIFLGIILAIFSFKTNDPYGNLIASGIIALIGFCSLVTNQIRIWWHHK